MKKLILFLFLLALTASGIAQDSFSTSFQNESKQYKSPAKAFLLSMGTTVGSVLIGQQLIKNNQHTLGGILVAGGLFLGPSAGNIYVGNISGVNKGLGTRLLATVSFSIGASIGLSHICFGGNCPEPPQSEIILSSALVYTGIGFFLYSTLYDWINSAEYAKKLNQRSNAFQIRPGFDTRTNTPTLGFNLRF